MSMDSNTISWMRSEIRRQLNVILSGTTGSNTKFTENIENMYPGQPTLVGRPIMHPYGLVSRAPRGVLQVVARQGEHSGNRLVLGHRDRNKPDLDAGDVVLYNEFGRQVRLDGAIVKIGDASADKPAVLGPELKEFLITFIQLFISHVHISSAPGAPTGFPNNSGDATEARDDYLENDLILSNLLKLLS